MDRWKSLINYYGFIKPFLAVGDVTQNLAKDGHRGWRPWAQPSNPEALSFDGYTTLNSSVIAIQMVINLSQVSFVPPYDFLISPNLAYALMLFIKVTCPLSILKVEVVLCFTLKIN